MIKKTHIAAFFLLVMILLAGCTKGDSGSSDLTLTPASVTSTPKVVKTTPLPDIDVDLEKLKGLQIHFIHPWTGETQSLLFSLVDQFNQTNEWGIHVIMDAPGSLGLLTQSVWAGIENDQSLDVVVAPVSLFLAMDEKYDLIVDLNPFVDSNKYGLDSAKITDFNLTFWGEDEVDGKRLGIPAQRTASVMIYNQTWAKELGFASIPETADEFKTQTCAANAFMRTDTDSSNDGVGGWITTTDALVTMNWLYGFDVPAGKSDLPLFANRAPEEAFTYLLTLLKQSCAWNSKNPLPHDYFARRQGAGLQWCDAGYSLAIYRPATRREQR